jgi:hypothetical protein
VTDDAVHLARDRIPDRIAADRIGCLIDEFDAMREQLFERRDAVVGEGADDLAVVVAVIGKAVRTDHRPIGQIAEQEIRRIRDVVFLLDAGAAAERDIATADNGMAADIPLGFDEDYGTACFACGDRGGKPVAPAPITTTSTSRSQSTGYCPLAAPGTAPPNVRVIIPLPFSQ